MAAMWASNGRLELRFRHAFNVALGRSAFHDRTALQKVRPARVLRAGFCAPGLWVEDYMSGVRRVLCFNADFEINVPRVASLASLAPTEVHFNRRHALRAVKQRFHKESNDHST